MYKVFYLSLKKKSFKFSAQGCDLAHFVGNGRTEVKMPYEIKSPLNEDFKTAQ